MALRFVGAADALRLGSAGLLACLPLGLSLGAAAAVAHRNHFVIIRCKRRWTAMQRRTRQRRRVDDPEEALDRRHS